MRLVIGKNGFWLGFELELRTSLSLGQYERRELGLGLSFLHNSNYIEDIVEQVSHF